MRPKWRQYAPAGGFGSITQFAATLLDLQELRNGADYDPLWKIEADEAKIEIKEARNAVELFQGSTDTQRKAFLFLLLFKPRG